MANMTVELVAVERRIWSGEANFVLARTTVGEIGVLPGHEPTLAQLEDTAVVRVDGTDGTSTTLHPGDLVIQNGTRHAWRVPSDKPATIFVVLMGQAR